MTHLRLVNHETVYIPETSVVARVAVRNVRKNLIGSARAARDLARNPIFDEKRALFLYGMADGQRAAARMLRGIDQ